MRTIAQSDADSNVQAAARISLEQRAGALIRELFSEDASVRIAAARELIRGWREEPDVVAALVESATHNRTNANGVYNTVVVLGEFSPRALQAHKQAVLSLVEIAGATGEKTRAKADVLARRLQR